MERGGNRVDRNGSERAKVASVYDEEAAREPLAPERENRIDGKPASRI
jgi:hypothetical protein